jgi:hypothetical protein
LVPGRGGKKDRLAFPEKVALSEIGLPVAEAKAKINISGSGAIGVAAIKDPRRIECVPASGNILEAQQMSWQRVQLIDKLLFSVARPNALIAGEKEIQRAREMLRARSTLAISSHEVVSHINYSKAECCEFLIGFQPLVLFVHNERAHSSIQSEFRNSSTSRTRRALE